MVPAATTAFASAGGSVAAESAATPTRFCSGRNPRRSCLPTGSRARPASDRRASRSSTHRPRTCSAQHARHPARPAPQPRRSDRGIGRMFPVPDRQWRRPPSRARRHDRCRGWPWATGRTAGDWGTALSHPVVPCCQATTVRGEEDPAGDRNDRARYRGDPSEYVVDRVQNPLCGRSLGYLARVGLGPQERPGSRNGSGVRERNRQNARCRRAATSAAARMYGRARVSAENAMTRPAARAIPAIAQIVTRPVYARAPLPR